jgi:geranylgeranyl reductase family protein
MRQVYDVIVIGAGPAGCAAARALGKSGFSVALFDKAVFPRDKTCGDALIPDAHYALEKLGLLKRVLEISRPTHGMRLLGSDGSNVLIKANGACVPRKRLDELLLDGAIEADVRFSPGHEFMGIADEHEKTYRVEFNRDSHCVAERARFVLLATGAAIGPIERAGLLLNPDCKSFAVRQYVRNERLARNFDELAFAFNYAVKGGYGWIFPGPDATFNTGIGFFGSAHKYNNPRHSYEKFMATLPLAKNLMQDGTRIGPLKGSPLRSGLSGSRFAHGGLLGIGECIGATFPLTGEGIGKAMETGILGAEAIITRHDSGRAPVDRAYRRSIQALVPKFEVYRKAEYVFNWPYLTDKLVAHAVKSEYTRGKVQGLFNETSDPGFLLTLSGWMRMLLLNR